MTSQVAHLLHAVLYSATRGAKGCRRLPLKARGVVRKATERCCSHGHWAPVGRNRVLSVPFRVFLPLSVPACTDIFLPLSVPTCTDIFLPLSVLACTDIFLPLSVPVCTDLLLPCLYRHVQISYCLVCTGMYRSLTALSVPVCTDLLLPCPHRHPGQRLRLPFSLSLLSLPRSRSLSAPHSFRHSLLVVPMRRTLLGTDAWSSDTASTSGAARHRAARHSTARRQIDRRAAWTGKAQDFAGVPTHTV